ncbi:MAG: NifU family protein [Fibrobacteres bacterium]|jgi:Fe-S cluster biogenesis protein NfuA|nr:NifU family protein [Fibrobacterota bacterium]
MTREGIEEAIKTIRPALQADGGDIEFVSVADNIVKVRLTGACSGCPHAGMTLKAGVERTLRAKFPEIVRVENVG